MSRRIAPFRNVIAAAALLCGCGESVVPGDPLIGTWRSDPFSIEYPGPPSMAEQVDELTFARDGSMTVVVTRRYPVSTDDPYSGCTWVERHTGWRWVRDDAGNDLAFGPFSDNALVSNERTGCSDPARNRAPDPVHDDGGLFFFPISYAYAIAGDRLALTADVLAPGGMRPPPQYFTRVR